MVKKNTKDKHTDLIAVFLRAISTKNAYNLLGRQKISLRIEER